MTHTNVSCGDCGTALQEDPSLPVEQRAPCTCGSKKRAFQLHAEDNLYLAIHEKVTLLHKRPGTKKPLTEVVSGDDFSTSRGQWMSKLRRVDRQNDHYLERITDPETGEVIHLADHRLSEHRDHGSARKGRP